VVYRRYDAVHHPLSFVRTRPRATGTGRLSWAGLVQSGLRCFAIQCRVVKGLVQLSMMVAASAC
jgi:hypothetical protein